MRWVELLLAPAASPVPRRHRPEPGAVPAAVRSSVTAASTDREQLGETALPRGPATPRERSGCGEPAIGPAPLRVPGRRGWARRRSDRRAGPGRRCGHGTRAEPDATGGLGEHLERERPASKAARCPRASSDCWRHPRSSPAISTSMPLPISSHCGSSAPGSTASASSHHRSRRAASGSRGWPGPAPAGTGGDLGGAGLRIGEQGVRRLDVAGGPRNALVAAQPGPGRRGPGPASVPVSRGAGAPRRTGRRRRESVQRPWRAEQALPGPQASGGVTG
jgi:hypothetical protein